MSNKQNRPINEVTARNYQCPQGEEHLYHVKREQVRYDQNTGQKISSPIISQHEANNFEKSFHPWLLSNGWTVEILHNPREWAKGKIEEPEKAKGMGENPKKER